jgi:predicted permease
MISYELWNRRFSGRSDVIGQTIDLGGAPYLIIGVLPPKFAFPFPDLDVWLTSPADWPLMSEKSRALSPFLNVFGRLRPHATLASANSEVDVLRHQYALAHPAMLDAKPRNRPRITPLKEQLVHKIQSLLWMLFGAVCFVLLIACSNVATLLLARSASRSQEFAVRSALGASRARLMSQLLSESVLLSVAGGLCGIILTACSLRAVTHLTAFDLPRSGEIHIDWLVLSFAAVVSLGSGLLFGFVPGLIGSRPDLFSVLRTGNPLSPGITRRIFSLSSARGALITLQIALSVTLLIGAGLLLKSAIQLSRVNLGFDPAHLLTARIALPPNRYSSESSRDRFFTDVLRALRVSPGVRSATAAMFLPMTGFVGSPVQDAAKPPLPLNERLIAKLLIVAPDYFQTLQIPLRGGRDFSDLDSSASERVAIIDEAAARHFWPLYPQGQNPVGQHLLIGGVDPHPVLIVGIVNNVHQTLENAAWPETVYVSFAQAPQASAMLVVRTNGRPETLAGAIRQSVRIVDRNQPVSKLETMDDLIDAELGRRRLILALLEAFSGAAFLLAIIGIYGVVSYSVVERRREIGVRTALGARRSDILRMVAQKGLQLALAGVAIGIASSLALTGVMNSLLYQVGATDPQVFLIAALSFLLVALVASFLPALRASRIDPIDALRSE